MTIPKYIPKSIPKCSLCLKDINECCLNCSNCNSYIHFKCSKLKTSSFLLRYYNCDICNITGLNYIYREINQKNILKKNKNKHINNQNIQDKHINNQNVNASY